VEAFLSYYQQFIEISKSNPIMASVIGLWGAGVVTYLLRNVPGRLWNLAVRACTRNVTLTSADHDGINKNFPSFLKWFNESGYGRWSHSLQLFMHWTYGSRETMVSAGYGKHYFFYKGRLFWFHKKALESTSSEHIKEEITITAMTLSLQLVREFIEEIKWTPRVSGAAQQHIHVFHVNGAESYWDEVAVLERREMETIALSQQTREKIIVEIQNFQKNQALYKERGIPYKLSFQLTGPTGTGKTSLVRALASMFEKDLYVIQLSEMIDYTISRALQRVPKGAMVLFEDYDSARATRSRERQERDFSEFVNSPAGSKGHVVYCGLTLSGVLNAVDGVIPLDDLILFWTTNVPNDIDTALTRKGRMDHTFELNDLSDRDIRDFIHGIAPKPNLRVDPEPALHLPIRPFAPIRGAELSALLIEHNYNLQAFVDSIPLAQTGVFADDLPADTTGVLFVRHLDSMGNTTHTSTAPM
jgi:chaperone BCS1